MLTGMHPLPRPQTWPLAVSRRSAAWLAAPLSLILLAAPAPAPAPVAAGETATARPLATRHLILVTLDGVRTQEIFGGLDEVIGAHDEQRLYSEMPQMRERYGGATPEARRAALMPNFWNVLAPAGVVLGNAAHGNHVKVQNRMLWSSPGYTEMLTGGPRPEVTDNASGRAPHPTALEHARAALGLGFAEVAVIGSWDGFPLAAASRDDAFLMLGAHDGLPAAYSAPELERLAELRREVMGLWAEGSNDRLTFEIARRFVARQQPRMLWLALVNSDDWAHAGRYDRYLEYLHRADAMLGELWRLLQSDPAYRGGTTLLVTTDHGRGLTGADWAEHELAIPGSDAIWLLIAGPDTADIGEVTRSGTAWQGQVAATLLQYLGLDARDMDSEALPPVTVGFEPAGGN